MYRNNDNNDMITLLCLSMINVTKTSFKIETQVKTVQPKLKRNNAHYKKVGNLNHSNFEVL